MTFAAGLPEPRRAFLETAFSQFGLKEATGRNDGEIQKFMPKWAHGGGLPWCAWFVGWCWKETFGEYLYGRHWGGAWDLLREAQEHGDLAEPRLVTPGDVFILLHSGSFTERGPGHAGIVSRVSLDGKMVNTIEGNLRNRVTTNTRRVAEFEGLFFPRPCARDVGERGLVVTEVGGGDR